MENRTPDLRIANATLYQLSYDPTKVVLHYNPCPPIASAKLLLDLVDLASRVRGDQFKIFFIGPV